jgi:hypothetical protein
LLTRSAGLLRTLSDAVVRVLWKLLVYLGVEMVSQPLDRGRLVRRLGQLVLWYFCWPWLLPRVPIFRTLHNAVAGSES